MTALARLAAALWLLLAALAAPVAAQAPAPVPAPVPAEVEQLRALLASPVVQDWLRSAGAAAPAAAQAAAPAAPEAAPDSDFLTRGIERVIRHRDRLAAMLPQVPRELAAAADALRREAADRGFAVVLLMVAALVGSGLLVEWRFLRATRRFRKHVLGSAEDTVPERLGKLGLRLLLALGAVASFAVASLGVLALLPLPPLAFAVSARALVAVIAFRFLLYMLRITLAPGAPERRVIPMPCPVADFWMPRLVAFCAILLTGWWLAQSASILGTSMQTHMIIGYGCFAVLVVLVVTWIWQRRARTIAGTRPPLAVAAFWSVYVVAAFVLWLGGAIFLLAPLIVAGMLPVAVGIVNRAVNHILRDGPLPEGADAATHAATPPSVLAAAIERGARLVLIVAGAAFLLAAWGITIDEVMAGDGRDSAIARVILYIVAVGVIFDFLWHLVRTAIDTWVAAAQGDVPDPVEARRRARLRTLLPILRNVFQVTFIAVGVMMGLAAVGVDIAPLIAGAGVVGVAIGFGAQTMVKDIIAGMFFLMDDAFRVGEYIVTGTAKGTVESFSLRSIKLRHHRGALYTVPFGSIDGVQNLSRDWVIEKMTITVEYGTDVAKAKKVIKKISAELLADPELAPSFLEPLKLQGVDALADSGIVLKVKFMAKPGEQFLIRRRAYAAIEKQFTEAGIALAFPTVRVVAEEDAGDAAAAARALAAKAVPPPAAAS